MRILRALRFSVQLGFKIELLTKRAMIDNRSLLNKISFERINSEFVKIIESSSSHHARMLLLEFEDVLAEFIPELKSTFGFEQNNPYHRYPVYEHILAVLKECTDTDIITKLAAFFHDIGKPHCCQDDDNGIRHFKGHGKVSAEMTDAIMRRLRFDNDTRENVVQLVYYHDASFKVGKKYVRRWLNKIGVDQFKRLLLLRRADIIGQSEHYREERIQKLDAVKACLEEVLKEKPAFYVKDLEIDGKDVMKYMLMDECPEVGYWLKHILKMVIDGYLENNREDLIYYMIGITDGWIVPE